ncbi:MAG: hypothetical protein GY810_17045 [Aureispira sp.]|nr:hypothetical protein [Aureispira sp.]
MASAYPKEIEKVLQLIETGDYTNMRLAIDLAKSIGVDILTEIKPLFAMNLSFAFLVQGSQDVKADLINIITRHHVVLSLSPEHNNINGLVFFQQLKTLHITLDGQMLDFNFEFLHLKELILKNATTFPLHKDAIKQLAAQKLQQLTIFEESKQSSNHSFIIPKEIGQIQSLRLLWIEHPNLRTIPEELLALKNLESLTLYTNNKSLKLPKHLLELANLNYAFLNKLPSDNLLKIKAGLELEIKRSTILTCWKQAIVQRANTQPLTNKSRFVVLDILVQSIVTAQTLNSIFYRKNPTTFSGYYFSSFLLLTQVTHRFSKSKVESLTL